MPDFSADRKFAQDALSHSRIISFAGQPVRVVELQAEGCIVKYAGNGGKEKVRYGDLRQWIAPPTTTPVQPTVPTAVTPATPPPVGGMEAFYDAENMAMRAVPVEHLTIKMREAKGRAIVDADKKRVWVGSSYRWSQPSQWHRAHFFKYGGMLDKSYNKLVEDSPNLRVVTACQLLILQAMPEYWDTIFNAIRPAAPEKKPSPVEYGGKYGERVTQDDLEKLSAEITRLTKQRAVMMTILEQQKVIEQAQKAIDDIRGAMV